ncbi:MAG: EamA/RhaT family transporter, partial [Alphaproteobacteria bacterium]|nr:EamA/RhaT family transporter [Alphaproteobacteria bacterium]
MGNNLLYVGTVLIWGSTWYAIKMQLGVVDPDLS